ncbi:energy transducer TonB [Acidovorax cavernicola]|nr:energy transducer TonB [Acidovorax cavernicola]
MPRSQLSRPPIALTAIVLEPPPGELVGDRLVGILSLFIDEQGHVERVDAEEPTLPPAFEQAAREAFIAAEFSPGEIDGRAVKSRLRVEVVFDNTSLSMP